MLGRKKGFSAKRSHSTSRRMNDSMVGTHVARNREGRPQGMNASSVSFSNARKGRRAARGEVEALIPQTGTRESDAAYAQRVNSARYAQERQRRSRMRRALAGAFVLVLVLGVAAAVGVAAFFGAVGSNMALRDSDAAKALTAPASASSPYYVLVSADLGSVSVPLDREGPDMLALVRIDTAQRLVTVVAIPSELQVVLTDGKYHQLREAQASGDAALIGAVSSFADVEVAHYVKLDDKGISGLVDALGGIEVEVAQEVDDPNAGDTYLPAGTRTLDGAAALTYLRATNLAEGVNDQLSNQATFLAALIARMLAPEGTLSFAAQLDAIDHCFQTDFSSNSIVELCERLKGLSASDVRTVTVPGYLNAIGDSVANTTPYFIASSAEWKAVMAQVEAGERPSFAAPDETTDVGSFTVAILNGTSITGAAANTAAVLTGLGFDVASTGNADQAVYEETLIVYDGSHEPDANAVASALGMGRTVEGLGYYDYDADVLVILGGDYKPVS